MNLNLRVGLRIVDRPETFPPMWIETPEPMPAFGTAEFNETRVIVNARRDILETKPFPWVVAGFAHELSHVVLFSVGHRLQHDEKAVDLTAMILGYQRYISDAEVTKTKGALLSASLMLLLLPLGIMFWRGTRKETTRLGYLTSTEALAACQYLAKIGYAPKTKVETGHRSSETGIAAFIIISGAAAIFSIAMLSVFFRGSADSSVHTDRTTAVAPLQGANKLNPPPVDIMAAQNRLIKLRFLAGPADGVWGTKSRMALRAFKIANGLAADDKWDDLVSGRLYSTQAVPSPLPLATGR